MSVVKENKTQILIEVFKLKFNELMLKFGDKRELEYQIKNEDNFILFLSNLFI